MSIYHDINKDDYRIRTFYKDVPEEDLIWHIDERRRIVEVIESNGWEFQFDDELPIKLVPGTIIDIAKERVHRIIKGNGKFVIKIKES